MRRNNDIFVFYILIYDVHIGHSGLWHLKGAI